MYIEEVGPLQIMGRKLWETTSVSSVHRAVRLEEFTFPKWTSSNTTSAG